MTDAHDLRAILDAAERAAATGDSASAERLIREGLSLQEASLGPHHPDLAYTLNNLGVVCEMTDKPQDAEQCYRRAYAIVSASLPQDHPSVATSRKNLEDFCRARQLPIDPAPAPVASPVVSAPPVAAAPPPVAPAPPPSPAPAARVKASAARVPEKPRPSPTAKPSRVGRLALTALAIVVLLVLVTFIVREGPRSTSDENDTPATSQVAPPAAEPTSPPPVVAPADRPAPAPIPPVSSGSAAPVRESRAEPSGSSPLKVLTAEVCRTLSTTGAEWRCETVDGPISPGTMSFYTRVASATDTHVEHRWYRGNRLHQRVELQVRANPSGYRTYSRATIGSERAGAWRLELRDESGRVLEEKVFIVK